MHNDYLISPHVSAWLFDDVFLLLERSRGAVLVYEAAASALWRGIGGDLTGGRSATILPQPERESGWIADWIEHRVLLARDAPAAGLIIEPEADWQRMPEPQWATRWVCRLGSVRALIAIERGTDTDAVKRLLHHFVAEPGPVDLSIEIRDAGPGGAAVLRDGREVRRATDQGVLLGAVYQALLEDVHQVACWNALIHGGAVARGDVAVAFPAPSGSGKSTLVAALIGAGYEYMADDLVAVAASGRLAPWPMPLSIKRGSWKLLEPRYPELGEAPLTFAKGLETKLLMPPDTAWNRRPRVKALVFPTFRAGSRLRLERLSPGEALVRLIADRMWLGYPLMPEAIQRFLNWLEALPCHALEFSELHDAERAVRTIFEG